MAASNVLVIGMKGLGVEIGSSGLTMKSFKICGMIIGYLAKNVALAGVKSVTIYDPNPVEIADLGTQVSIWLKLLLVQAEASLSSFYAKQILESLVQL